MWRVLDAPVSGGTRGAEAGTLTIMVGGDAAALEEARPVLEPMANKIFHLGDVGCGNVAKLVNNMIGLTCNSICAEGFVLGVKGGIDPQVLYDLLTISTANNWSLQQYPQHGVQGQLRARASRSRWRTRTSTWRSAWARSTGCRCRWPRR